MYNEQVPSLIATELLEKIKTYYRSKGTFKTLLAETPITVTDENFSVTCRKQKQDKLVADIKTLDSALNDYEELHKASVCLSINDLLTIPWGGKELLGELMIWGVAGTGKTTLCQYLAYKWANDDKWVNEYKYLFWLPLRNLRANGEEEKQGLAAVVYRECVAHPPNEKDSQKQSAFLKEINQQISSDRVLFLLDGYDEIAMQAKDSDILARILDQIKKTKNRIITSRPYHLSSELQEFAWSENIGFTDQQIKNYITHYFNKPEEVEQAHSLWAFLKANPRVWGTMHIPLHLELFCDVWRESVEEGEELPQEMSITCLYKTIIKYSLRRCLKKREIETRNKSDTWLYQQFCKELAYLEKAAFVAIENGKVQLDKKLLQSVLEKMENIQIVDEQESLFDRVLATGFLRPQVTDAKEEIHKTHYFLHLTFQEFFAARYLVQSLKQPVDSIQYKKALTILCNKKYHHHYAIVFKFVAGMLSEDLSFDQTSKELLLFWQTLCEAPLDLLEMSHYRILGECLNEANCDPRIPQKTILLEWMTTWIEKTLNNVTKGSMNGFTAQVCLEQYLLPVLCKAPTVIRQSEIINTILEAVKAKSGEVRKAAFNALKYLSKSVVDFSQMEKVLNTLSHIVMNTAIENNWYPAISTLEECLNKFISISASPEELISPLTKPLLQAVLSTEVQNNKRAILILDHLSTQLTSFLKEKSEILTAFLLQLLINPNSDAETQKAAVNILGHLCELVAVPSQVEKVLNTLQQTLMAGDPWVRRTTVQVLTRLSKSLVNSPKIEIVLRLLLQALINSDEVILQEVTIALETEHLAKQLSKSAILSSMVEDVMATDTGRQKTVIIALRHLRKPLAAFPTPETVFKVLLQAVKSPDQVVRSCAILTLGHLGKLLLLKDSSIATNVLNTLLQALKDSDEKVRLAALEAFQYVSECVWVASSANAIFQSLLQALEDPAEQIREAAIKTLASLNRLLPATSLMKLILRTLLQTISDSQSKVWKAARETFVYLCAFLALKSERATVFELLSEVLKAPRLRIRKVAVKTLWHLSEKLADQAMAEKILTISLDIANDPDEWIRKATFEIFGHLNEPLTTSQLTETVIKVLSQALKDSDMEARCAAIQAFGKMSKVLMNSLMAKGIIDNLLEILTDCNSKIKEAAIQTLGQFNKLLENFSLIEIVAERLLCAIKDENATVRKTAIQAFSHLYEQVANSPLAQKVVETLFQAVGDSDKNVQKAVIETLGIYGKRTASYLIIKMLSDRIHYMEEHPNLLGEYGDCWENLLKTVRTIPLDLAILDYIKKPDVSTSACLDLARVALLQGVSLTFTDANKDFTIKIYKDQKEITIPLPESQAQNIITQFCQAFNDIKTTYSIPLQLSTLPIEEVMRGVMEKAPQEQLLRNKPNPKEKTSQKTQAKECDVISEVTSEQEAPLFKAKKYRGNQVNFERENVAFRVQPNKPIPEIPQNAAQLAALFFGNHSHTGTVISAEEIDASNMTIKERRGFMEHIEPAQKQLKNNTKRSPKKHKSKKKIEKITKAEQKESQTTYRESQHLLPKMPSVLNVHDASIEKMEVMIDNSANFYVDKNPTSFMSKPREVKGETSMEEASFSISIERQGVSAPLELAKLEDYKETIKEKIKEGPGANPEYKLLLEKLIDPRYKEEKKFLRRELRKFRKGMQNPAMQNYLKWLGKNYAKIKDVTSTLQFEERAIDLYVRDKATASEAKNSQQAESLQNKENPFQNKAIEFEKEKVDSINLRYWYQDNDISEYVDVVIKHSLGGYRKGSHFLLAGASDVKDGCYPDQDGHRYWVAVTPAIDTVGHAAPLDSWLDKSKQPKPVGEQDDRRDVWDEIWPVISKQSSAHVKILFGYNDTLIHWLLGEIQLHKTENQYTVILMAHDPYGGGEMDETNFALLSTAIQQGILQKDPLAKFEFKRQSSPYGRRQSKGDLDSCGVIVSEDMLKRINGVSLDQKEPYPLGIETLRRKHLQAFKEYFPENDATRKNFIKRITQQPVLESPMLFPFASSRSEKTLVDLTKMVSLITGIQYVEIKRRIIEAITHPIYHEDQNAYRVGVETALLQWPVELLSHGEQIAYQDKIYLNELYYHLFLSKQGFQGQAILIHKIASQLTVAMPRDLKKETGNIEDANKLLNEMQRLYFEKTLTELQSRMQSISAKPSVYLLSYDQEHAAEKLIFKRLKQDLKRLWGKKSLISPSFGKTGDSILRSVSKMKDCKLIIVLCTPALKQAYDQFEKDHVAHQELGMVFTQLIKQKAQVVPFYLKDKGSVLFFLEDLTPASLFTEEQYQKGIFTILQKLVEEPLIEEAIRQTKKKLKKDYETIQQLPAYLQQELFNKLKQKQTAEQAAKMQAAYQQAEKVLAVQVSQQYQQQEGYKTATLLSEFSSVYSTPPNPQSAPNAKRQKTEREAEKKASEPQAESQEKDTDVNP